MVQLQISENKREIKQITNHYRIQEQISRGGGFIKNTNGAVTDLYRIHGNKGRGIITNTNGAVTDHYRIHGHNQGGGAL